jgi:hypothetical protein
VSDQKGLSGLRLVDCVVGGFGRLGGVLGGESTSSWAVEERRDDGVDAPVDQSLNTKPKPSSSQALISDAGRLRPPHLVGGADAHAGRPVLQGCGVHDVGVLLAQPDAEVLHGVEHQQGDQGANRSGKKIPAEAGSRSPCRAL